MTLRPYSSSPLRALLQVGADVAVVVWSWFWVRFAMAVDDAVRSVGDVGYRVQGGAAGIKDGLDGAADQAGQVPLVGDTFGKPFTAAGGAAQTIADAGRDLGDRVTGLALPLALVVALAPVLSVVLLWLPARYRFARRAGETAALAAMPGGQSLLALRALATRPVHDIARISPDAVEAWRRDDADVVARLAALEQRRAGVRPRPVRASPAALGGTSGA
ncbi:hypothetical protein [Kineosporia sp. R_H_3]|uniref:hypothetical protein n=1 Tax=Kineosporia sp. R_H_3 TaxID=1961848 RepID=UPI000B4C0537|nr:hypothetical protein [Kineosporia sp. R_H_3]